MYLYFHYIYHAQYKFDLSYVHIKVHTIVPYLKAEQACALASSP